MQGLNDIEDEERRIRENAGVNFDMILKTNIEGIIVKWAHQVWIIRQTSWLTMLDDPRLMRCSVWKARACWWTVLARWLRSSSGRRSVSTWNVFMNRWDSWSPRRGHHQRMLYNNKDHFRWRIKLPSIWPVLSNWLTVPTIPALGRRELYFFELLLTR